MFEFPNEIPSPFSAVSTPSAMIAVRQSRKRGGLHIGPCLKQTAEFSGGAVGLTQEVAAVGTIAVVQVAVRGRRALRLRDRAAVFHARGLVRPAVRRCSAGSLLQHLSYLVENRGPHN